MVEIIATPYVPGVAQGIISRNPEDPRGILVVTGTVLPALLGLGFRAFSVDAAYIAYLASSVRKTHVAAAGALAEEICRMKTSSAVRRLLGVNAVPGS